VPEQLLQQLGPVNGVGVQELRELSLRQQHDLEELVGRHPHQVLDFVIGSPARVETACQRAPG